MVKMVTGDGMPKVWETQILNRTAVGSPLSSLISAIPSGMERVAAGSSIISSGCRRAWAPKSAAFQGLAEVPHQPRPEEWPLSPLLHRPLTKVPGDTLVPHLTSFIIIAAITTMYQVPVCVKCFAYIVVILLITVSSRQPAGGNSAFLPSWSTF